MSTGSTGAKRAIILYIWIAGRLINTHINDYKLNKTDLVECHNNLLKLMWDCV